MWEYTEKVMDLFYNPQNQGTITDQKEGEKVVSGEVGSIACGDALSLHLKVNEASGEILDAKFQTFGCASAIASSSALTAMLKGKTIDEAMKIKNQDIAGYLGGLPEEKMHCSVMGEEALEAAIFKYKGIEVEVHEEDHEGALVCSCFAITENKIKRVIRENNLKTAEEVTNYVKAGGGCGSCLADIDDLIESVYETPEPTTQHIPTTTKPATKLTNLQKITLIQQVLEQEVRPVLAEDGGDVELFDIDGDRVLVTLKGACGTCSSAMATLKGAIEATLKERVSESIVVESV
ncbi:Fe-S cluster assembly protein NifU [Dapis sp. BLCC M229]|uniref:Fe-S cluster assembly protein NifU n=1 Tax=Dapis sp. BLCC M229 TaxID=3400188 RepID=UPI003CF47864